MSYEPPVKIYETMGEMVEKIREDGEYQIWAEIKRHVDVDKDELIKALKYDRDQYNKGFNEGYEFGYNRGIEVGEKVAMVKHAKRILENWGDEEDGNS